MLEQLWFCFMWKVTWQTWLNFCRKYWVVRELHSVHRAFLRHHDVHYAEDRGSWIGCWWFCFALLAFVAFIPKWKKNIISLKILVVASKSMMSPTLFYFKASTVLVGSWRNPVHLIDPSQYCTGNSNTEIACKGNSDQISGWAWTWIFQGWKSCAFVCEIKHCCVSHAVYDCNFRRITELVEHNMQVRCIKKIMETGCVIS